MPQPRESISCGWLSTRSDTVRNSGVCTRNRPCCGRRTLFDANGESGVCQAEQTQGPASVLAAIRCRSLAGLASVSVFIGCRRFGPARPSWGSAIPMPSHPTGFEPVLPARRRFRTGGACPARPSIGSRHHPQPFAHRAETGQAVASNRGQRPSADPYSLTIQLSSSVIVSEWRPRASLPSSAGFRLKKLNQRHDTQGGAWFHAAFCFDMNMIGIAG